MLKLEEYIAKRKKEDGMDEFDKSKRSENTKMTMNYVFEYFNQYIDITETIPLTTIKNKKVEKYRRALRDHFPEVIDWLVFINIEYGKWMDRIILNKLDDPYFFLFTTDKEFNELAYKIYYSVVEKYDYMSGTQEMISLFLKGHQKSKAVFPPWYKYVHMTDELDLWIKQTYEEYGINIYKCLYDYAFDYSNTPNIWPAKYKVKSKYYDEFIDEVPSESKLLWSYDYKHDDNICNINEFYRNMPKKPFLKRKKKYIEAVLFYIFSDFSKDTKAWNEYLNEFNKQ